MKHLRRRTQIQLDPVSMTHQSFKDECNINNIMKKYERTGQLTHVRNSEGVFGDFTNVEDYQVNLNKIILAEEAFMTLPAHLRKQFNNSPQELLEFLHDDSNRAEAERLGFTKPRQKQEQTVPESKTTTNQTTTTQLKATETAQNDVNKA